MKDGYRLIPTSFPISTIAVENCVPIIERLLIARLKKKANEFAGWICCKQIDAAFVDCIQPFKHAKVLSPFYSAIYETLCFFRQSNFELEITLHQGDVFFSGVEVDLQGVATEVTAIPEGLTLSRSIQIDASSVVPTIDGILAYLPTKRNRAEHYSALIHEKGSLDYQIYADELIQVLPFITATMLLEEPHLKEAKESTS